ncbi:neuropeptide CCHamide-1 receptor [Nephila pilipes]|uniref:Neuropeptide CCHamide-1 receptor n=1 Tax=Nephila pilipes TaxID=299642 RepID=A0A8X6U7R5_NEPPI|nr:neuropeptide CCHamide-1 receptor [Nephila pilipes]
MEEDEVATFPWYTDGNETFLMTGFWNFSGNGSEFNNTHRNGKYVPYEMRPETYIVPLMFAIIFFVGLVGNGTLIFIFIRNKFMRSIPNTYIISLAAGDFLVIVGTVPFISTIYTFESWPYGNFLCKFSEFIRDFSSAATVMNLTLLSINRYIAIVKPLYKFAGHGSKTCTLIAVIVVWVIAGILAIPGTYFSYLWEVSLDEDRSIYVCYPFPEDMKPWYPQTMVLARFLLLYLIPLSVISVLYALMARHLFKTSINNFGINDRYIQQKLDRIKVAKIVLVLIILFAVCYLPNHVFMLWFYFHPNAQENYSTFWHVFKILGYILGFCNSCLNPVALYFSSSVFRGQFDQYLFCTKKDSTTYYLSTLRTLPSSSHRSTIRTAAISKI